MRVYEELFIVKPDAPEEYRGIFTPIQTNVTGLQVGELLPELAKRADKYTVIRSVSTLNKPGDHSQAPLYWNTGNPRLTTGSDEYPMYGSVVNKLRPGPADLPTFVALDEIDVDRRDRLLGQRRAFGAQEAVLGFIGFDRALFYLHFLAQRFEAVRERFIGPRDRVVFLLKLLGQIKFSEFVGEHGRLVRIGRGDADLDDVRHADARGLHAPL